MTITLPAPFTGLPIGAHLEHGHRQLSWTLLHAGEIHRNRYTWAWIHIDERVPFKGEPLWLSAQRRVADGYQREPFTTKGREALSAQLLPIIARHGFDRLWTEVHRQRTSQSEAGIDAARRLLDWHQRALDVRAMHIAGHTVLRPVTTPLGERPPMVSCPSTSTSGWSSEPAIARVWVDGEQVGWMTKDGQIVPTAAGTVAA